MRNNLIYSLSCPVTNQVHYVGKSSRGMLRPLIHMKKSHSKEIREWVKQLRAIGHLPHIKICEYVEKEEYLEQRETYWIKKYQDDGEILLNVAKARRNKAVNSDKKESDLVFDYSVGSVVKKRRMLIGLSQTEFARKAGVGLRFLRELEQGKKKSLNMGLVNKVLFMLGYSLKAEKITQNDKV